MGGEQGDGVTTPMGFERDACPRAAGEDVGNGTHPVDVHLGVAGGDEDVHPNSHEKQKKTERTASLCLSFYGGGWALFLGFLCLFVFFVAISLSAPRW